MVTLMFGAMPRWLLVATDPLARHPPSAHFFGPRGILEIQDHWDPPDISLDMRRDVGVAAVEGETVHAPVGLKKGDLFRLLTVGNIVNLSPVGCFSLLRYRSRFTNMTLPLTRTLCECTPCGIS